jgi:hypothetical protein
MIKIYLKLPIKKFDSSKRIGMRIKKEGGGGGEGGRGDEERNDNNNL